MDEDLQYLTHFFTDKAHLFRTITMAAGCQVEEISDRFVSQKGWYWGRYAPGERADYLARRRFVEKALIDEYTRDYGRLKEKVPVYFYLYPKITPGEALALARERTNHQEAEPGVLMVKIRDIPDITNVTFTLNDSCTSYRQKMIAAGIDCSRGPQPKGIVLPDHNKVFPFSLIEQMHRKYAEQDLVYEVQVWDYELLKRMRYTILGEENA